MNGSIVQTPPVLPAQLQELAQQRMTALPISNWYGQDMQAGAVLALSDFVASCLNREPALFAQWQDSGELCSEDRIAVIQERFVQIASLPNETEVLAALRRLRMREMALIAWRDIAGLATVEETIAHLSCVAQAAISSSVSWLQSEFIQRYGVACNEQGQPQHLLVLGMGKLGGKELNFSSDIDLIFLYGDDGHSRVNSSAQRSLEHREYYTRFGQRLIHLLATPTSDGIVFRVDMRLRPYGDSGPLALSLDALEEYYQDQGREWERFAAIKARVLYGDDNATQRLHEIIRPFVYRRYIDFGVLEAIRRLKLMIAQDLRRRNRGDNIKLGQGGIREIEFIVQAHQLIRGGRDPELRSSSILPMLVALQARKLLSEDEYAVLLKAYLFLRKLENSLQEINDEQTQILPQSDVAQLRLACILGFNDFEQLRTTLDAHRHAVHSLFQTVFGNTEAEPVHEDSRMESLWRGRLNEQDSLEILRTQGFSDPVTALHLLQQWREAQNTRVLSERGRVRLNTLMPALIESCAHCPAPDVALPRVIQLLHAIARRTAYLELLAENRASLEHLLKLCAGSALVAEQLTHHPLLLDELLDVKTLYSPPDRGDMRADIQQSLLRINEDDREAELDALRECRHAHMLRLAAAVLSDAIDLGHVSQRLTDLAEVILEEVFESCWRQMCARHGQPPDTQTDRAFNIIAYGKFGGAELSFASDLDLVFLYDRDPQAQTDGAKPIGVDQFYTRLAQRIVHCLSTRTAVGLLYEVDTRLRPSGNSGLLVSHWAAFEHYQHHDAWIWEHQALVRARPIVGSSTLARQFIELRKNRLVLPRDETALATAVVEMRHKMRKALDHSQGSKWDLKHGAGGVVDIEFLLQFLILKEGAQLGRAIHDTHSARLLQSLADHDCIGTAMAAELISIYKTYREAINRLALNALTGVIASTEYLTQRTAVQKHCREYLPDFYG